jgi:prepilin-type N-terminal cleavage/methylation domain-containing protein
MVKMQVHDRHSRGFTVIEVLIVLAIAALILLIVFLAVPAAKRNERNYERKQFVALAAAAMDESYTRSGLRYPQTPQEICAFTTDYLAKVGGGNATCTPSVDSSKDCVITQMQKFGICFHSMDTSPHSYIGTEDEVSIQLGHWCTPNPNPFPIDNGNPITAGNTPGNHQLKQYVIWTRLEPSGIYCMDNYPN